MKENWQLEFWKQITDNHDKLIKIINKMRCNWTNNEEILNQAIVLVYTSFEKRQKEFKGDNYLPYITMTAKNVILQMEQKEKKLNEVDIDNYIEWTENDDECTNINTSFVYLTEQEITEIERLKLADELWPAVINWVSNPQNVNPISAGLFKFRFLTNNSLSAISKKTGYSAPTILKRTKEVLELVKIEFKDFGNKDYN